MIEGDMLHIKVPASSANLGPGFDSLGLALNLYLTLDISFSDSWEVIPLSKELEVFPTDESNFIIQTARNVAREYKKELVPCKVKVWSNIPLARGLGSSASAIVAGIELADCIAGLQLTKKEKFILASKMEGHPDNVGASIFGGLIVGCQLNEDIHVEGFHPNNWSVLAVVPPDELLTKAAREVLPKSVSFSDSVSAGAVANVLVAALLTGNMELAGKMMRLDKYHQPYRKELVPHLQKIEDIATKAGAYGVALSGAGPTVLCFVKQGEEDIVSKELQKELPDMHYISLEVDQLGSTCTGELKRVHQ